MNRPGTADKGGSLLESAPARVRGLSPLVTELLELMRDPSSSIAQLGAVVATDRALSERILRIANSPVLGIPSRVSSVPRAVTLLGFEALRETVMRMVVTGAFRNMVDLFTHYEEFWSHSIACGLFARQLARKHPGVNAEDAFVAGLFHDIGMIAPEDDQMTALCWRGRDEESGVIAARHQETGARLARQWGLGERIVEAIRYHHQPIGATLDPLLVATVHVADTLCRRLDVGRFSGDSDAACDPVALERLGMTEADLHRDGGDAETASILSDLAKAPSFGQLVASLRQSLVDAISGLPYHERLTLALCYQEGLQVQEVARLLGTSEEEVQILHDRALAALVPIIHKSV